MRNCWVTISCQLFYNKTSYEIYSPSPDSPEVSGENPFVSVAADTKDLEGQQDQLLKIPINKFQILPANKKQLFLNKTI